MDAKEAIELVELEIAMKRRKAEVNRDLAVGSAKKWRLAAAESLEQDANAMEIVLSLAKATKGDK